MVDLETQVAGLALKLRILALLILDLLHQFLLLNGEGPQPVLAVLIQLLDLTLETLLVLLVLLLVLALDDLLRLLRDSIQLNVKGSLFVVFDLQGQALDLVLDLLELGVVLQDELHIVHLHVALVLDAIVFRVDHVDVDQDCIFVVSGDRQLGHLNLALLKVDDDLEVELELLLSIYGLFEAHLSVLKLFYEIFLLTLEMQHEVTQVAQTLLVFGL